MHLFSSKRLRALCLTASFYTLGSADRSIASGGSSHGEEAPPPVPAGPKREYNPGPVEKFPEKLSGLSLKTGKPYTYNVKRGRAAMVFFVASWCEPCQQLMPNMKSVAQKFERTYVDVIYVFAHDTRDDAAGFAKEHKLSGDLILATPDILRNFKNPPLPSVYIGDRYNYFGYRVIKLTSKDFPILSDYLEKLTAL